jgi:hypothetical protein
MSVFGIIPKFIFPFWSIGLRNSWAKRYQDILNSWTKSYTSHDCMEWKWHFEIVMWRSREQFCLWI